MKKAVVLFLAFIVSLSAIGVQVTVHYCMGKASYSVFGIVFNKKCKCIPSKAKHKSKCCSTEHILVKAEGDTFSNSATLASVEKACLNNFLFSSFKQFISLNFTTSFTARITKAPPDKGVPLNTLYCIFRI